MKFKVLVGHGLGGGKFVYPDDIIEYDMENPQEAKQADYKVARRIITAKLEKPRATRTEPAAAQTGGAAAATDTGKQLQ